MHQIHQIIFETNNKLNPSNHNIQNKQTNQIHYMSIEIILSDLLNG